MSEFANDSSLMAARITGSVCGVGISLIYLLPKTHREAASRFFSGLICGLIFGGPVGLWIARQLQLDDGLSASEIMLAGSAIASLSTWWALGVLVRLAEKYSSKHTH